MAEIRIREPNTSPEVKYFEVFIPDDQDLGTGKYTTALEPNALASNSPASSVACHPPEFLISVNINSVTKLVPVLLGKADGSPPASLEVYSLPSNLDPAQTYTFEATFEHWQVTGLTLDGVDLHRQVGRGTVSFWLDLTKPPNSSGKGHRHSWGAFRFNRERCELTSEGNTLRLATGKSCDTENVLLSVEVPADVRSASLLVITWDDEEMNCLFGGKLLSSVRIGLTALSEFESVVDSIYGTYLSSMAGYRGLLKEIVEHEEKQLEYLREHRPDLASMEILDLTSGSYYDGDPNTPGGRLLYECSLGEYKSRMSETGANARFIANMCIIAIYQYWEDQYRQRVADALGKKKDEIVADIMGDLRLLRRSIIHRNGFAIREIGDCQLLRWFGEGDEIVIDARRFDELVCHVKSFIAALRRLAETESAS